MLNRGWVQKYLIFRSVCTKLSLFVLSATPVSGACRGVAWKKLKFYWKKFVNYFASSRKCRTFALAFGKKSGRQAKRRDLWHTANSNKAASLFPLKGLGMSSKIRQFRYTMDSIERKCLGRDRQFIYSVLVSTPYYIIYRVLWIEDIDLGWRVWSWLRMNASYRLNTCKSRGSIEVACYFRWRPANGWVTRIQPAVCSWIALRNED